MIERDVIGRSAVPERHECGSERQARHRLVLLSFLMLFVELALIRWTSAYVAYLAYFTNFVLLASFLGIGVGFLRARDDRAALSRAPLPLVALTVFVLLFPVQVSRAHGRSLTGLFGMFALPVWLTLPIIFVLVTITLALIAEGVAGTFRRFPPLEAYRLDITGSLLGIVAFSALSFVHAVPLTWALVIAGAFFLILRRSSRAAATVALAVFVLAMGAVSFLPRQYWSPYYRITLEPRSDQGVIGVRVNGLPHQAMVPLDQLKMADPFYFDAYRHLHDNPLRRVLIIGAGTGNDVAVALSMGAQHVDAVEIDPVIQHIGELDHPNHPYQDPRVTPYVDDGRAFLHNSTTEYDLIVFALPDSLTLVSAQSSLRLESYLFTLEALKEVRTHLAPGGAFTMYNYYRPDVFDRFAQTITLAFGSRPCIDAGSGQLGPRQQAVLTVGSSPGDITCSTTWSPSPGMAPAVATDDHPFPYLNGRTIPRFYLTALLLMLAASILIARRFGGAAGRIWEYKDLFLMGVAFLLLETKSIVQFALLFGTTWFVNTLVFAGVLVAVFMAVELSRHVRLASPVLLYASLGIALALAWIVPQESLLGLSLMPRFLAAVALAFSPVFLANLIFAQRFEQVGSSTAAFGANLLGAMIGGLLEYSAMVVGYRALLILVLVLYTAAYLSHPKRATA